VIFLFPLAPIFVIFFIGCVAETNRAPFDLAEAESELVSGFMTEHSAAIFVFFFLAEYASIVLICIFTSILFLGGYSPIISLSTIQEILYYIFGLE
jgi:NADH-ubiquinone oxidoreductase chain 1